MTVTAAEDDDAVADAAVTLTHTVSGGDYAGVTADSVVVTIIENDAPTLAVADARGVRGRRRGGVRGHTEHCQQQ